MRSPRTALIAALVAGSAAFVSCGPGVVGGTVAPTSPAGSPASSPAAPAATPTGAGPSPSSALALPHDDPALEAELPDEVDGAQLFKLSVGPISSAGNAGAEPLRGLADDLGDGSGNFSLAYANDPASPSFNLFALRIPGADSDELLERYTGLTVADAAGSETDSLTLAGKSVVHVTAPNNPIGDVWFYAVDETIYGVQAGSEGDAAKLIELLP